MDAPLAKSAGDISSSTPVVESPAKGRSPKGSRSSLWFTFRVLGFGFWVLGFGFSVLGFGFRVLG